MKELHLDLLKWTLGWEAVLLLFLFVHLTRFFWKNKDLEVTLGFLLILSLLITATYYDWSQTFEAVRIKSWILLILFFLTALSPYTAFAMKKLFLPRSIRRFIARGGPLDEVVITCEVLSQEKVGALIAVERRNSLKTYANRGVSIDSKVKRQLLVSLFAPNTPTHDGGVIVVGDRIAACSAIFPLSNRNIPGLKIGTRHRAALGLSEQTDALLVIVSEETGKISLAREGKLYHDIAVKKLRSLARKLMT